MSNLIGFCNLFLQRCILLLLSLFIRRDEKKIAIGSWLGMRYMDNSRYLAEYLDKNCPEYTVFWVGNKEIKEEVLANNNRLIFLERNKFKSNIQLLRCKYFFFSQMHNADIASLNVYNGAVLCYLHHGMPIKKWAADGLNQGTPSTRGMKRKVSGWLTGSMIDYDFFVTSSPLHDATNLTALHYKGATEEKNIHSGTPRNDMLINYDASFAHTMKERYSASLGFEANKKVVMYLPTYRRISKDIWTFSSLTSEQAERLNALLVKHNAVLIEKSHFAEKVSFETIEKENVKFADSKINLQEMLLFTDIMISDYSGAYLDFILMDRPVVHFAYDYEYYKNTDSGLYYDIEDFSAGEVVDTFDSVLLALDHLLSGQDDYTEKRRYVRDKYMAYEKGTASEQIINAVIRN